MVGIAQSIVELFTAGVKAYKRQQRQNKLEGDIKRLRTAYNKLKGAYDECHDTSAERQKQLENLREQYSLLLHTYGALLRAEFMDDLHDDKRPLDPSPY